MSTTLDQTPDDLEKQQKQNKSLNVDFKKYQIKNNSYRNHTVAFIGEFFGTFMFLFIAFAIAQNANSYPTLQESVYTDDPTKFTVNPAKVIMIALGFGFGLTVAIYFVLFTGGNLNPNVSLALVLIGAISFVRFVVMVIAQILGGIAAAAVVYSLYPGEILFANGKSEAISKARGLFLEMFGTAVLVLTVLFTAVERTINIAPLIIGISVFMAHMILVPTTGASINIARSLGPQIVASKQGWPVYFWIYIVGPSLGSFLSVGVYKLLKFLNYETCSSASDNVDLIDSKERLIDENQ
ncbi:aquaporin-like protein [Hanseniaspora valbyensis NRRL Y-1626]|uniref:Aquaporin-like protein n=1 Tax=Hanseniaspora valbyensis NRRL Y-1626 TaxID=766949 RepID=A0A1B7THC4_9ASCO|nr:aquaporin-like protein [Hanseniaspora valbyensis NRRL Y-1626]